MLGDKRHKRSEQFAERNENLVERQIRTVLVKVLFRNPEPPPRPPNEPVAQVSDHELLNLPCSGVDFKTLNRTDHLLRERVQPRDDPPVQRTPLAHRNFPCLCGVELVDAGVGDEEEVGVPERVQELLLPLFYRGFREPNVVPQRSCSVEVPPQRVRSRRSLARKDRI